MYDEPIALVVGGDVRSRGGKLLGQADEAISILRELLQKPGDDCITTALLRADPIWNPIRRDPRFQKLVEAR